MMVKLIIQICSGSGGNHCTNVTVHIDRWPVMICAIIFLFVSKKHPLLPLLLVQRDAIIIFNDIHSVCSSSDMETNDETLMGKLFTPKFILIFCFILEPCNMDNQVKT